jgi:hypothetical protein
VRLVDYVNDHLENDPLGSWSGIEDLIARGVDEHYGNNTTEFLREAYHRHLYLYEDGIMQAIWRGSVIMDIENITSINLKEININYTWMCQRWEILIDVHIYIFLL